MSVSGFVNGRNNPSVNFKVFYTKHFKVIYQDGLDSAATRAAVVAETALPGICKNLHVDMEEIPLINIVFSDVDDISNGLASPVGQKIELFAPPFQTLTTGSLDWIDRVVVHELAHQITFLNLRRTFGLYSTFYYLIFIPSWFIEGIAQYEAEEWDKNRDFLLRSSAVSGSLLRRERTHGYAGLNPIESRLAYEQGHSIYRFMATQFGSDIGGRILDRISVFSPTISAGLRRTIRMDEKTLFKRWEAAVTKEYAKNQNGTLLSEHASAVIPELEDRIDHMFSVKRIGGGAVFVGIERSDCFEENLYVYRKGFGLVKIDGPDIQSSFDLSADKKKILYSKLVRTGSGAIRYRIQSSLLDGTRLAFPEIEGESPVYSGMNEIAFLRTRGGRTTLHLTSIAGNRSNEKEIRLPDTLISAYGLKYHEGRFFMSAVMNGSRREIVSIGTSGADFRIDVAIQGADCRYPAPGPNGRLAYMSNQEGPFEIWVKEKDGVDKRVASDYLGLFSPDFNDDNTISVISVISKPETPFRSFAYVVDAEKEQPPVVWDTSYAWKKGRSFDAVTAVKDNGEEKIFLSPVRPYHSLLAMRPTLLLPGVVDERVPEFAFTFQDPVGRHSIDAGAILGGVSSLGWHAAYTAFWLEPVISLDVAKYRYFRFLYDFPDSLKDTYYGGRLDSYERIKGSVVKYFNRNSDLRFDHGVYVGAVAGRGQYIDTIINMKARTGEALSGVTRYEDVYGFIGYFAGWQKRSSHSDFYPLDSWQVNLETYNANPEIAGDYLYNRFNLELKTAKEIGESYSVVAAKLQCKSVYGNRNVNFRINQALLPRGKEPEEDEVYKHLVSANLEYRFPLTWDMGINLIGFYMEALYLAGFVDAISYVPYNGGGLSDFTPVDWTSGILFNQRILVFGNVFSHFTGMVYYDPEKVGSKWDYSIGLSGQANF